MPITPDMSDSAIEPDKSAIKVNWAPGPTWLLRRDRILRCLSEVPRGKLLEVGCGAGAMLGEYARLGFECQALETSSVAADAARQRASQIDGVYVRDVPGDNWSSHFDYVVAFEVLEHIERDREAVTEWCDWLKPGGHFLMSVPAHMRRWNASDQWAGHFRRYERTGLCELIESAGMTLRRFDCYGFPLSNIVQPFRARVHKRLLQPDVDQAPMRQFGTDRSGVERAGEQKVERVVGSLPGRVAISFFCQLQRLFLNTELGNNYFLHAIKTEK